MSLIIVFLFRQEQNSEFSFLLCSKIIDLKLQSLSLYIMTVWQEILRETFPVKMVSEYRNTHMDVQIIRLCYTHHSRDRQEELEIIAARDI